MVDIDEFMNSLPPKEKVMAKKLRAMILDTDPRLEEKFSFGVPYYRHNRLVCFVWPASQVPPEYKGKVPEKEEVTLGFNYGNLLSNAQGLLLKENRKQVYVIRFSHVNEIQEDVIREILQEAVLLDDTFKKSKSKKK